MLIKSVNIANFRCIKALSVEFADLTAFVGRNGSGKSTVLQALRIFYNTKAPVSENDFFNSNTSSPIEITVEYRDLGADEQAEFAAFVDSGTFAVTKRIIWDGGRAEQRYYAATRQIPAVAEVKSLKNTTEKRNAWNTLIDEQKLPGGFKSVRGDDPDALMTAYERQHPELTQWVQQEVQFFGPPNIGGGKLDNYTKFVYVPAVRDASDDSADKKGSPLFQLLDFIVMRRFRARADVRALQDEFSSRLSDLYEPSKLSEFSDLATDISQTLHLYVPNAQFNLHVSEPSLPDIPVPAIFAALTEDEYSGSIDRKGHGLQRTLIFSLLQHLAVAEPVEPPKGAEEVGGTPVADPEIVDEDGDTSVSQPARPLGPDLIIAIEEPELYQHPLRAKHLSRVLLEMSRERTLGPGARNQIAYTTHSPYFVDLERFDHIRIMRKLKLDQSEPPCTHVARYSLQSAAQRMAEITGSVSENFTAESFRSRAYSVMTQTVNEGFFADGVVLVEGDTEAAALVAVAEQLGKDWLSKGVAIVPVGGKTKIDRAVVVFSGLGIPTYIIFDADCRHRGKQREQTEASTNRLLLKLCAAVEVDFPPACAEKAHACFEDDFETYCKTTVGEEYESLREAAANAHGYERPTDGVKNFDVVVELVGMIYDKGCRLQLLEKIVEQVERMLPQATIQL